MTLFNAAGTDPRILVQQVQMPLIQIRLAMDAARGLHDAAAGISLGDLTAPPPDGPGLGEADAQAILDACADAYGFSLLYDAGTDPRNPPAGYPYGNSQKRVIGFRAR